MSKHPNEEKRRAMLSQKEMEYRNDVFKRVFGTEEGELVLTYLEDIHPANTDLISPNKMYHELGRRDAIRVIRSILKLKPKKKEKKETTNV